jgi:hypothetical protein
LKKSLKNNNKMELQDWIEFQSSLDILSNHPSRRPLVFDSEDNERLANQIRLLSQEVDSILPDKSSNFIRSLELVDDLSVATDFAFQQYQRSVVTSSSTSNNNSVQEKRDNKEVVKVTEEEETALPPKKQKKNPFSSAKDKFTVDGGKFDEVAEKPSAGTAAKSRGEEPLPAALAAYDKALVEKIESEIIHHGQPVMFDDISGLQFAKKTVQELICWYVNIFFYNVYGVML